MIGYNYKFTLKIIPLPIDRKHLSSYWIEFIYGLWLSPWWSR